MKALATACLALAAISCATSSATTAQYDSAPPKPAGEPQPAPGPSPSVAQAQKPAPQAPPPREDAAAVRERKTRALIAEVAKQRGLAETTPLNISFEDGPTFRASLDRAAAEDTSDPEVERARWVAFGFAGPDADPKAIAMKVLNEQIAAFYDPHEKKLHIPIEPMSGSTGAAAEQEAEVILAHEIEHGLQDEHYPIPDVEKLDDDDRAVAIKAIYEGDATFVMVAVPASRSAPLDGAKLLQVARQLRSMPSSVLASMSGKQSPELDKAPKIVREELLIPYFGGMQLIAELYRAGGYPLVNQLFEHPPQSSEQVLHPEKYVAGEQPVVVQVPALPKGATELTHGRLGEFGVRTLLSDCLEDGESRPGSEGWGGDAYLISMRPDGKLLLQWSTTWDSEEAAQRFAVALSHAQASGCFPLVGKTPKSKWSLSEGAAVASEGRNVALERGFPPAGATAILKKLLQLPQKPSPNAPPVGAVVLAADNSFAHGSDVEKPVPPPAHPMGKISNGVWKSDYLGMRAAIPPGFVEIVGQGAELRIQRGEDLKTVGAIVLVPAPDSESMHRMLVATVMQRLSEAFGGKFKVNRSEPHPVSIDGVQGSAISVTAEGTPLAMEMTFWPACSGRLTYLVTTNAGDPTGIISLEKFVSSIKSEPRQGPAPVCADHPGSPQ